MLGGTLAKVNQREDHIELVAINSVTSSMSPCCSPNFTQSSLVPDGLLAVCVACNAATVLFIPIVHVCRGRRIGETNAGKTRRKASRVGGSGGGGGGREESLLEQGGGEGRGVGIRME